MFSASVNSYLAINQKGCVEIKNSVKPSNNVVFENLKLINLPEDIQVQLNDYINSNNNGTTNGVNNAANQNFNLQL